MKRNLLISLLAVAPMVAVSTGCATSRPITEQADDGWISSKVGTKLAADPDIRKFDIDVDTLDGVVTLRGTVESEMQKREALEIARNTEGVREVIDEMQVGEGELINGTGDAWLTTKVKSQLAVDLETRAMNIDVDTRDDVVTLSGIVPEQRDKEKAERIARNTEGVRDVNNELIVRGEMNPQQQGQQNPPEGEIEEMEMESEMEREMDQEAEQMRQEAEELGQEMEQDIERTDEELERLGEEAEGEIDEEF